VDLAQCNLYGVGMNRGLGTDSLTAGWWLWLGDFTPVDAIQYYRSFLPAS
jgi:hypothetical protein